jgi:hypothetical protein
MQQSYQEFKQVREFGDLFSDTFAFISNHWKSFFGGFFKLAWPYIVIALIGNTYYQVDVTDNFFGQALSNSQNPFSFFIEFIPSIFLLGISSFLLTVVSYAYVNLYIKAFIENKEEIDLKSIQDELYSKLLSVMGLQLLVILSIIAGSIICFLPGIYLLVPLSFALSVYLFENKSVTDAYAHTFQLIRDNWWITFAAILVMSILIAVAGGIFQLPVVLYTMIKTATSVQETDPQQAINSLSTDNVIVTLNAIASFASYVFNLAFIIMTVYIYFNLNERQFGTGSFEQIDELGNE